VTRRVLVLAALAAAVLAAFAGSSAAGSPKVTKKCVPNKHPGVALEGRTTLLLYCGTAKASVHYQGKTHRYTRGACYKALGSLNIGFGMYTTAVTVKAPKYTAFYLVAPAPQDGTYRLGVLTLQFKGKSLDAAKVKVVVKAKRTRGTFSGQFRNGPKFTGSFTCK
jgi:hypothetical protein